MATTLKPTFTPQEIDRIADRVADRLVRKIKAEISNIDDEILNVDQVSDLIQRSRKYVYRHKVELGGWQAPESRLLRFSKNHVIQAMKGGFV